MATSYCDTSDTSTTCWIGTINYGRWYINEACDYDGWDAPNNERQ